MKISHSASPRNRSIRNSRSPAAAAGVETAAGAAGGAIASAAPARGSAATRPIIDTIQPRLEKLSAQALAPAKDHIGLQFVRKLRRARIRATHWLIRTTVAGLP